MPVLFPNTPLCGTGCPIAGLTHPSLRAGVFWTGGSLNPARSFGPAVATRSFKTTQWIYWVGPLAGSIFAVLLYKLIKSLEYETVNPDPEAQTSLPMSPGPTAPPPPAVEGKEKQDGEREVVNGTAEGRA